MNVRPTEAVVDLDAIAHNVRVITAAVAPSQLWAVVKADGYGHGATPTARAALRGGACGLAVALVSEGEALRSAGISARVMVLSEPPAPGDMARCASAQLEPTVGSPAGLAAAASAGVVRAHLKVDTGMHRMGVSPGQVVELARQARQLGLEVESIWTHFARADEPGHPTTDEQLRRFLSTLSTIRPLGLMPPAWHCANSAGALAVPASRGSRVRAGISIYGLSPSPDLAGLCRELKPALKLHSVVSGVRRVRAGDGVSYGHHFVADRPMTIATVPIGYADGVPRRFHQRGQVLLGGRLRPIAGVVTMDQLMVCCDDDMVSVGDEVVLIGRQGDETISVADWAHWLDTIVYEVVCAISTRVPRRYVGSNVGDFMGGEA